MVEVPNNLTLSHTVDEARSLFRKELWSQVSSHMGKQRQNNGTTKEENGMIFLKRVNWNVVQNTQRFIHNEADISAPALLHHPFAVVMVWLPLEESVNGVFDSEFLDKCVKGGSIYGTIHDNTQVVVQLFFSGLKKKSEKDDQSDQGVGIMIVDSTCAGYGYNIPNEKLAVRCVQRLMDLAIQKKIGNFVTMIPYSDRSKYDQNLYAMYITSSCASKTATLQTLEDSSGVTQHGERIRPCKRTSRPSRIINNLRFLMNIVRPECGVLLHGLLLDEVNTLDEFRRVVMDV